MAEVLGILASGIAVGQATAAITTSLKKLKSIWDELRDVPEDIIHLSDELEIVHAILVENERENEELDPRSRSQELALKLTHKTANKLTDLVDDLRGYLQRGRRLKRKMGAVKVILEKEQVKKLKSKLKSCIWLLTLANQQELSGIVRRQPEMLAIQITILSQQVQSQAEEKRSDDYKSLEASTSEVSTQQYTRTRDQNPITWRLHLLHRQWSINLYRSQAGWDLVVRMFQVLPQDSVVYECVRDDDVDLLRALFRDKKASPLTIAYPADSGIRCQTLLEYAVRYGSLRICRLLLESGARVYEETIETESGTLSTLGTTTAFYCCDDKFPGALSSAILPIGELIVRASELESTKGPFEYPEGGMFQFCGTLSLFKLYQRSCYPNYYEESFEHRASTALSIATNSSNTPDVVRCSLGDISASKVNSAFGIELLYCIASRIGNTLPRDDYIPSKSEIYPPLYGLEGSKKSGDIFQGKRYPLCGWQAFLSELLAAGANLDFSFCGRTVLSNVISGAINRVHSGRLLTLTEAFRFTSYVKRFHRVQQALHAWLEVLQDCGVDLKLHGRMLTLVMAWEKRIKREFRCDEFFPHLGASLGGVENIRLIGFEYGTQPDDWKFWFSEPTDQLAGEFWDMIEHPERSMPGAWDEFNW